MAEISDEYDRIEQRAKEIETLCREWKSISGYKRIVAPRREGIRYRCPCCYYKTLPERGHWDICPVCFWEDDGQDDSQANQKSASNHGISLNQARRNYRERGASLESRRQFVRSPLPEEL